MKPIDCISPDDLDWVLELPDDDLRRVHVRGCPRCRALVDQYVAFLDAAPAVEPALLADADARLGAALGREIGPPRPGRAARRSRERWWDAWLRPSLRPALGLAAIAVATVLGVMWMRAQSPETTLRGASAPSAAVAVERAESKDGAAHLAWSAVAGATVYQVRFYSADLHELTRIETPRTSLDVAAASIPANSARRELILVRIVALRGGDELATSTALALERP